MISRSPLVEFRDIQKRYRPDGPLVVERLSLNVERGEFLTLLGPSGSGKTTTLMMLAGFEAPSSGDIFLNGASLAKLPPYKRNMGVVFQNYALFPHMTVAQNIAFPLGVRGATKNQISSKVAAALDLVKLHDLADRRPDALSGGQRQRVALARALVFEPDIVLMDEPLGALDRQLREHLQMEIKRIQRLLGLTIVYVTHDQDEALTMSDRIAVFSEGRIQQIGSPKAVYNGPANAFVADFVGENNLLSGTLISQRDGDCIIRLIGGQVVQATAAKRAVPGDQALVSIRPENLKIGTQAQSCCNTLEAHVEDIAFLGDHSRIRAIIAGNVAVIVRLAERIDIPETGPISIGWQAEHCYAFPESGISYRPHGSAL